MKMNNENKKDIEKSEPQELNTAEQTDATDDQKATPQAVQGEQPSTEATDIELIEEPECEENAEGKKPKREKKHSFKVFMKSSKFKHGGISTAFTVGFIIVVILINVIVGVLGERFPSMNMDLTKGNTNSLSAQALQVISKIKVPTTIYVMATEQQTKNDQILTDYGIKYSQVGELTAKIAEKNTNIKVEYIDLDKNPTFANTYKADNIIAGDVIIKTDKRYRVLAYTDLFDVQQNADGTGYNTFSMVDSALASGLNAAIADTVSVVAFDTGHSEKIDTTTYKKLLANNAFDAKDVNLLTESIPDKTQMLVLGCPSTDYTEAEIKKLDAYMSSTTLAADRALMVTFNPDQNAMPNLATFLKEWGIEVPQAVIAESDQTKLFSSDASYILSNVQTTLSLTGKTVDYGYFITPVSNPINQLFDSKGSKTTYSLSKSNETSYLVSSTTKSTDTPEKAAYNTGVLSQDSVKVGDKTYKANVIALGSTMMFNTEILSANTFGNGKYMVDLSRYATGTSNAATAITETSVQTNVADITLNTELSSLLGIGVFTLLIPLLIAITGICVYYKRRHL